MELASVVRTPDTLPNGQAASAVYLQMASAEELRIQEQDFARYLANLVPSLQAKSITVTTRLDRGDPARQIPAIAAGDGADLIALASHGRAGTEAFWAGSVAAKVLRRTEASMLLIPAPPKD